MLSWKEISCDKLCKQLILLLKAEGRVWYNLIIKSQKFLSISYSTINPVQQSDHINNNQIPNHHPCVRDPASSLSFGYIPSKL